MPERKLDFRSTMPDSSWVTTGVGMCVVEEGAQLPICKETVGVRQEAEEKDVKGKILSLRVTAPSCDSCFFVAPFGQVPTLEGASQGPSGKESACQCRTHGFDPWVRKIPGRRAWRPTPVFLPGESHGQRSLTGYSPWSCRVRHN